PPARGVRWRWGYLTRGGGGAKAGPGGAGGLPFQSDPAPRGGDAPDGRKVKATLHWVSARHAIPAEVRLYDRLFTVENPSVEKDGADYQTFLNPNSLEVLSDCQLEPSLAGAAPGSFYQFERHGYFCADTVDAKPGQPVFNRTVGLRDTWAKIEAAGKS